MNIGIVTHSAPPATSMRLSGRSQTFPALHSSSAIVQPDPRHVPKRYEETRAAFVQDFSHRRILSLGFDVHYRLKQQAEFEREEAVRDKEAKVWRAAEGQKQQALDELRKQLTVQTEQYIQRLKRQHHKALQEKVLEVETALRREMLEAVEKEKEEGRRRLEAAIEANDRKWEAVVIEEVKAARLEEIRKADAEKAEIRSQHEAAVRALTERARQEKAAALQELERRKEAESVRAVAEARAEERSLAQSRAALVQEQHEAELAALREAVEAEVRRCTGLEAELAALEREKVALQDSLLASRQRYVELVHRVFEQDTELGLVDFMQADDALVADILTERGVEPGQLRGLAWRPHSPGPQGAGVGSVQLQPARLPGAAKVGADFV